MQSRTHTTSKIGTALALFLASAAVGATTFTFNFNSLAGGATSTQIATYMGGVFGSSVGVTGAIGSQTYNGDGHVVGPTLGTSNGATSPTDNSHNHSGYDTFIINNNFNSAGFNAFTLNFGAAYTITSISFDWEIFPDASCSPHCSPTSGNWPDIELMLDGSSTSIWSALGIEVGSPAKDPQNIGVASVNFAGAHSLTFKDWPAEIGIDNLVITGHCAPTRRAACKGTYPSRRRCRLPAWRSPPSWSPDALGAGPGLREPRPDLQERCHVQKTGRHGPFFWLPPVVLRPIE